MRTAPMLLSTFSLGLVGLLCCDISRADDVPIVVGTDRPAESAGTAVQPTPVAEPPLRVTQEKPKPKVRDSIQLDGVKPSEFLRLKRDGNGTVTAMQTAITRYVGTYRDREVTIDLIGAVHIGDNDYYSSLNDEFERYDAMLYELVAPPERNIPTPELRDNKSLLTTIRRVAQTLFEFEMQLDGIDYTAENFVHADLSPQALKEKITARGENMMSLFFSMMSDMLKQQNKAAAGEMKIPQFDLAAVIQDPNGATKAKRALSEVLVQNLEMTADPDSTLSKLLIDDRNDAALKVMAEQIKAGNDRLALFYGAAHMPDFEQKLLSMGFKKDDERWVTAWDLRPVNRSQAEHLAKMVTVVQIIAEEFE